MVSLVSWSNLPCCFFQDTRNREIQRNFRNSFRYLIQVQRVTITAATIARMTLIRLTHLSIAEKLSLLQSLILDIKVCATDMKNERRRRLHSSHLCIPSSQVFPLPLHLHHLHCDAETASTQSKTLQKRGKTQHGIIWKNSQEKLKKRK